MQVRDSGFDEEEKYRSRLDRRPFPRHRCDDFAAVGLAPGWKAPETRNDGRLSPHPHPHMLTSFFMAASCARFLFNILQEFDHSLQVSMLLCPELTDSDPSSCDYINGNVRALTQSLRCCCTRRIFYLVVSGHCFWNVSSQPHEWHGDLR